MGPAVYWWLRVTVESGEWSLYAGAQPTKSKKRVGERPHSRLSHPKFFLGNREITFGVKLEAEGTATQTGGIVVSNTSVVVSADFEQEILAFYLSDYVLGAQWLRLLDHLKKLGIDINSVQRVTVYGLLGGEFRLIAEFQPPPTHFAGAEIGVEVGVKAATEPDIKIASMTIYLGGKLNGEFEIPYPNPSFKLQRITGAVYGGVSVSALIFDASEEFVCSKGQFGRTRIKRHDPSWPKGHRGRMV